MNWKFLPANGKDAPNRWGGEDKYKFRPKTSHGAVWFLTSENEWYKAAYHKNNGIAGDYWLYPTSTNTVPNNNLPLSDTGNSVNFWDGDDTTTGGGS
jgi:hypothetical protein